jgi:hypothetical protein
MKQKKRPTLDITGFFFLYEYSGEGKGVMLFNGVAPRPSPEYSCGNRNLSYPIQATSFVSTVMYLTCTIMRLLSIQFKKSCENSFV